MKITLNVSHLKRDEAIKELFGLIRILCSTGDVYLTKIFSVYKRDTVNLSPPVYFPYYYHMANPKMPYGDLKEMMLYLCKSTEIDIEKNHLAYEIIFRDQTDYIENPPV